jgi:predicted DNA-binding ribbon-helix-helix protein
MRGKSGKERVSIRGNLLAMLTSAAQQRNMPLEQLVHEVMEVWLAEQRRALREDEVKDFLRLNSVRQLSPQLDGYVMKGATC